MAGRLYAIDLKEQMAVCDSNYIRLMKLLTGLEIETVRRIALPHINVLEQIVVSFELVERFKYTTTVKISQNLLSESHCEPPEMFVRVYHDASTAEVTSYQNHRNFRSIYPLPNRKMYQTNEKEQLNLFLADWLELCLTEGLSLENSADSLQAACPEL